MVGVPVMTPVAEMESPGGAPVSEYPVMVAPPPDPEVVADTVTGEMAVPAVEL